MLDSIQLSIKAKCGGSRHPMLADAFRMAPDARVFKIDNVDMYCRNVLHWTASDVLEMNGLCVKLPFPVCLFQLDYPVTTVMRLKNPELRNLRRWRYGILAAYSGTEVIQLPAGVSIDKVTDGLVSGFQNIGFLAMREAEWNNGKVELDALAMLKVTITGNGEMVGDLGVKLADGSNADFSKPNEDTKFTLSVLDAMVPMFYSLSLLNCKNVRTTVECNHTGRTRREREKTDRAEWHWLDVPLINKIYRGEIPISALGGKQGLHVVRGHFKEFTEAAPLLGKHVGRYWWGEQVRGDIKLGVIQKEYRPNARLLSAIKGIL